MSELKVDKLSPRTGTALTLGDSGDTITLAAGATAVGFGGITKSASDPAVDTNPAGGVGTVWLNTTTGEMFSLTDATAGSNVWTNTGDGTGSVAPTYMSATGGTITTDGNFKVHTFLSSGTFTPTIGNALTVGDVVDYLVVSGGGSGGNTAGGGGGGGGLLTSASLTVTAQGYGVVIGAGGTGQASSHAVGSNGIASSFAGIAPVGGGGGGGGSGGSGGGNAGVGGSGGGGATSNTASYKLGGAGTAVQGNDGGDVLTTTGNYPGAGGGGAGAVGVNVTNNLIPGNGGAGLANSYSGSSVIYAGGGGGSTDGAPGTISSGGSGGGGAGGAYNGGSPLAPVSGSANTGSGGGGAATTSTSGAGGSGVVIIRYQFQAA